MAERAVDVTTEQGASSAREDAMETPDSDVHIDVFVSRYIVRSSDRKVIVIVGKYDDGWHVEHTPPDCIWPDPDEAIAVASHVVRRLYEAAKLRAQAVAIENSVADYATAGRTP